MLYPTLRKGFQRLAGDRHAVNLGRAGIAHYIDDRLRGAPVVAARLVAMSRVPMQSGWGSARLAARRGSFHNRRAYRAGVDRVPWPWLKV
jgi:hypothetical protein